MNYSLALLIILLVDGLKMMIEFFRVKPLEKKPANYGDISVIMSAYNEEKMIEKTIQSFINSGFSPNKIFVCDDGSTDNTSKIVSEKFPKVKLFTEPNKGKVNATNFLLEKVKTKYVFVADADIVLENNFYIPVWKLDEGSATGIAFNIVPYNKPTSLWKRILVGLQSVEYAKSMLIGRQSQNKTMSVSCISGAAGVFVTERLKKFAPLHSCNFSGEDLQRTLIELINDGNIVFSNSIVYTDVPETFSQLSKQRVIGWWAGLYHCLPLSFRLFFFRKSPTILRYEIVYDVLAMVTDPFKIFFFVMLLISGSWKYIAFLYVVYFLMETVLMLLIKKQYVTVLPKITLILLYPIYAFVQMIYRMLSFFRYVYHRLITKKMKPLKKNIKIVATAIVLLISTRTFSQTQSSSGNIGVDSTKKKDFVVSVESNKYFFSDNLPNRDNIIAYAGYKKLWWEGSFINDKRQTVGYYIPKGLVWARWRQHDYQAFVNRNVFNSKGFISAINLTYQQIYRTDVQTNRFIGLYGVELEKYINDNNNLILSVRKEWGRRNDVIVIATYDHKFNDMYKMRLGAGVNSFSDLNFFAVVTLHKNFYLVGTYIERFDYNDYNRGTFGIGVKF